MTGGDRGEQAITAFDSAPEEELVRLAGEALEEVASEEPTGPRSWSATPSPWQVDRLSGSDAGGS